MDGVLEQRRIGFVYALLLIAVAVVACGKAERQLSTDVASEQRDRASEPRSRPPSPDIYVVSASGMGGIRLGMTLDEARRGHTAAKFERVSDGDGAALVKVTLAPDASMILWAEEDDPATPIDWSKKITTIETFSAAFHTSDGVHPGSLVLNVETVFGKTKQIEKSEIESREYITFEKQPAHLTFRLDYTGIFPADSRRTTTFDPGAKIQSISVSAF